MTFSQEWDAAYQLSQRAIWPWSDLVSYVNRYAKPSEGFQRVLELGCGAGANIPFFLKQGVEYCAIEGSVTVVSRLHEAFPELRRRIVAGDFTATIPFEPQFDLVIDRSSLTHNSTKAIRTTLASVVDLLRSGGRFIGIDWFSTEHSAAYTGDKVDENTRRNIQNGQFSHLGVVHFSDKNHIMQLLAEAGFRLDRLEHKKNSVLIPVSDEQPAWWNFVATKT